MTPEHWDRLRDFFHAVLNLPREQRVAFVDSPAVPESLRADLHSLLKMHETQPATFERGFEHVKAELEAQANTYRTGDVILNRFRIIRPLGVGGMGEVYEVNDSEMGRIALKTIRASLAESVPMLGRFRQEVMLARKVGGPNVCRIHELFEDPEKRTYFLTMEFLAGETLADRIEKDGALPIDEATRIAHELCAGLSAIHEAGIVHRDFKTRNVMLTERSGQPQAVITDFGLARDGQIRKDGDDSGMTQPGVVMGTPEYMAPEQFEARTATAAADIFALGVVFYKMVTGKSPFPASSALGAAIQRAKRPPSASSVRPGLPKRWDAVISRCLEHEPEQRFQSAVEVATALRQPKAPTRRTWPYWVAACGLAVAAAMIWSAPRANDIFHPLPNRRFVVLDAGPDTAAKDSVLLGAIINVTHDRLVRAESRVKDLLILGPEELVQQKEDARAIGANLGLNVSLPVSKNAARLQLVDLVTGSVLREVNVPADRKEPAAVPEAVAAAAAVMLKIPSVPVRLTDEDEVAALAPPAYQVFAAAEDLRRQPNDTGLDTAIEKYGQALESNPRFAYGYARIASAYIRKYQLTHDTGALSVAGRNAEKAVNQNHESPGALLSQAICWLYSGRTEDALAGFAVVLRLDPGDPEVYLNQAAAYRDLNQLADEEKTYRLIIAQRPNYYRAYNALGMSLYRQGRNGESETFFQQAVQIAPKEALPYANLGLVYALKGRKKEAIDAFHASLERAPSELAWLNLGDIAFEDHDYRIALQDYEKARDLNPSDDLAWRNIADSYSVLGDRKRMLENYEKAADLLGAVLRTNPKRGAAWMTMAFYQSKLGRHTEAEAALQSAERAGASSVPAQFMRAQALAVLGDKSDAIQVLAECVRRGLAPAEIEIALDLKDLREDTRWKQQSIGPNQTKERELSK